MKEYHQSQSISKGKNLVKIREMVKNNDHFDPNGRYSKRFKELICRARFEDAVSIASIAEASGVSTMSIFNWSRRRPTEKSCDVRELKIATENVNVINDDSEKSYFRIIIGNILELEVNYSLKFLNIKLSKSRK